MTLTQALHTFTDLLKEKMSEMEIDDTYDKQEVIYHIESWFKELKLHLSRGKKKLILETS